MKSGNKIIAIIVALMLVVSFAFSFVTIIVKADSLVDFVVYYPLSDGSWSSYTLEEIPADTLLEIGTSAIYQEGVDVPLYSYPDTYQKYTEDFAALEGPSDAVSTVSYDLPLEMEANIGYVILFDPVSASDQPTSEVTLSFCYPDLEGNMLSFSTKVIEGAFIEITESGVYRDGAVELLAFGQGCNVYYEGIVEQYNSTVIPTGALPVEFSAYDGMPTISVYNYAEKPVAPVIRYNADDDSITWTRDPDYKYQIKVEDPNGKERIFGTYGMTECLIYPYDYVSELGENTIYVRSLVYAGGDTRLPVYSEWSNGVLWTAALPSIDSFYIDGSTLFYAFSGIHAAGDLLQNNIPVEKDLLSGTYEKSLIGFQGLHGFKLTVSNKYGIIESPILDYYEGFDNDTYGTFYAIGQIMNGIVKMLDNVSLFGITLWRYLFTGFLITAIIPFLCLVLMPSRGIYSRGGNASRINRSDEKND